VIELEDIKQFEKDLTFVRNFLEKLPREVASLSKVISCKDREQEDLLHHIEFVKLPANQGYTAYRRLHIIRNERRQAKNLYEVVKLANDLTKDKLSVSSLSTALGEVRKIINNSSNKKYKPRELNDLNYGNNNTYTYTNT